MDTIYFFGSFPNNSEPFCGGGEEGNLRTVLLLRRLGHKVRIVKKLRCKANASRFVKNSTYPFRLTIGVLLFANLLLFGSRKALVHISGFYGPTIFSEYLLALLSRMFGYKYIYEMRGGGAETFHNNGSSLYRRCFQSIIDNAKVIFSQGIENGPFLRRLTDTPIFYYPNFIRQDELPGSLPQKPTDIVNLVYFGRIVPQKNVRLIVDIATIIQQHVNASLTIIGNGDKNYEAEVQSAMERQLKAGTFTFIPGHSHKQMKNLLLDKHFLLFPSFLDREGHSNTITEAMSCGVVPISSPQGFSRAVVGNASLIIDGLSAQNYATRVLEIIDNKLFDNISKSVFDRVADNFSEKEVGERLKSQYDKLFERQQR